MRQDSQSSYSFGKTQNVGSVETSEEKVSVSLEKDFIFCFHFYIYIYTYIYIYILYIYIYIYIFTNVVVYIINKNTFLKITLIITLFRRFTTLRSSSDQALYTYIKKDNKKEVSFIVPTMNLYPRNGQLRDPILTHNKLSINLTSAKFATSVVLNIGTKHKSYLEHKVQQESSCNILSSKLQ